MIQFDSRFWHCYLNRHIPLTVLPCILFFSRTLCLFTDQASMLSDSNALCATQYLEKRVSLKWSKFSVSYCLSHDTCFSCNVLWLLKNVTCVLVFLHLFPCPVKSSPSKKSRAGCQSVARRLPMGTAFLSGQSSSHMPLDSRLVYRSHFTNADTDVEIGEKGEKWCDWRNPVSFQTWVVLRHTVLCIWLIIFQVCSQTDLTCSQACLP